VVSTVCALVAVLIVPVMDCAKVETPATRTSPTTESPAPTVTFLLTPKPPSICIAPLFGSPSVLSVVSVNVTIPANEL